MRLSVSPLKSRNIFSHLYCFTLLPGVSQAIQNVGLWNHHDIPEMGGGYTSFLYFIY